VQLLYPGPKEHAKVVVVIGVVDGVVVGMLVGFVDGGTVVIGVVVGMLVGKVEGGTVVAVEYTHLPSLQICWGGHERTIISGNPAFAPPQYHSFTYNAPMHESV
jgi:hypothetical protein